MDEAKLREIEERANAATPGMWLAVSGSITDWNGGHSPTMEWIPRGERSIDEVFGDANFIVHARDDVPALVAEVRRLTAALATARREGAEEMREAVKAEIHAAFHYNDPPDDGVERPIGPIQGQREAHQTLRRLLSRVCAVLTEGGAT